MERVAADDRIWYTSEVDIFRDLSAAELRDRHRRADAHLQGRELLFSPADRAEPPFVLKQGRVRLFRVFADGRALTTAILSPGTIFGEMVPVGQDMHDNYAEDLDEVGDAYDNAAAETGADSALYRPRDELLGVDNG